MTADVDADFHLHERARLALGDDAASTPMNHLPRDVDQLATKQDLAQLGSDLRADIERSARVVVSA